MASGTDGIRTASGRLRIVATSWYHGRALATSSAVRSHARLGKPRIRLIVLISRVRSRPGTGTALRMFEADEISGAECAPGSAPTYHG